MSYPAPNLIASDFKEGQRVAYVHYDDVREYGIVSSVNYRFVFVRFDKQVAKLGWSGATSQSCDPRDLVDATAGGAT